MRESGTLSASTTASTDGPRTDGDTSTLANHISAKLVKAFVQPDGSHGNGAGVVLLPGNLHNKNSNSNEPSDNNAIFEPDRFFPSDSDCIKIAKRVGLSETSFVLFSKKFGKSCDNYLLLEEEQGRENIDGIDDPCHRLSRALRDDDKDISTGSGRSGMVGDIDSDSDGSKSTADFYVKWYTPECEVDMCGHATVALAGYIHSMVTARTKKYRSGDSDKVTRELNRHFWRMQCKAGLLGIEVVDGVCNSTTTAGGFHSNNGIKRNRNKTGNDDLIPLPCVVMEQANPEFCGIVDPTEIAASLSIEVDINLAIAAADGSSDDHERNNTDETLSELVFPFPHCEIVSTGGRDLMIPIRSTVLNEMKILGNNSSSSNSNARRQLCDNINGVSKRYNIVGYHMFEVDDDLFKNKHGSEIDNGATIQMKASTKSVRNDETIKGWNLIDKKHIHLNELIRIYQMAEEKGRSGNESCFKAVMSEHLRQQAWQGDTETNTKSHDDDVDENIGATTATIVIARQSRVILVTGVRNFAPYVGIPEESATGSANGALACYLVKHLFLEAICCTTTGSYNHRRNSMGLESPIGFRFRMEQGRAMGEPCLIDAEINVVNGAIGAVKVGGLVSVTGESLDLDLTSS